MHVEHTKDRVTHILRDLELVRRMDPTQHQHVPVLLHISPYFRQEIFRCNLYFARIQRAGKSADESAARRRYHVIDRRSVPFKIVRTDPVVLSDGAVHPEQDRLGLGR